MNHQQSSRSERRKSGRPAEVLASALAPEQSALALSEEIHSVVAEHTGESGAAAPQTVQLRALSPAALQARELRGLIRSRDISAIAARGIAGDSQKLPHLETIQGAFGEHDVGRIKAHVDGPAASASQSMGAHAYATGEDIAFAESPDLHTAAHEAAHVVQQRKGVQLDGGVGRSGDGYERHADAVADRVVRGESAEPLLDSFSGSGTASRSGQVQRKAVKPDFFGREQRGSDRNVCDIDPKRDIDLTWSPVAKGRGGYRVNVEKLFIQAVIHVKDHPASDEQKVPNTVSESSSANLNNTPGHPCYWKTVRWEMANYLDLEPQFRQPHPRHWHSTEASSKHESAHFFVDHPRILAKDCNWKKVNKRLDRLKVAAEEQDARAALEPLVQEEFAKLIKVYEKAVDTFIKEADSPPIQNRPLASGYNAGFEVISRLIGALDRHVRENGWDENPDAPDGYVAPEQLLGVDKPTAKNQFALMDYYWQTWVHAGEAGIETPDEANFDAWKERQKAGQDTAGVAALDAFTYELLCSQQKPTQTAGVWQTHYNPENTRLMTQMKSMLGVYKSAFKKDANGAFEMWKDDQASQFSAHPEAINALHALTYDRVSELLA